MARTVRHVVAAALVILVGSCSFATVAPAQFREPVPMSRRGAVVGGYDLGTDLFGLLHLAFVEDGRLLLRTSLPAEQSQVVTITTSAAEPSLDFYAVGLFLAYTHSPATNEAEEPVDQGGGDVDGNDGNDGEQGFEVGDILHPADIPGEDHDSPPPRATRRVCYSSRFGTSVNQPVPVSTEGRDCRAPGLALSPDGRPVLVWESPSDEGATEIFLARADGGRVSLGRGTSPVLEIDRHGRIHILFLRDNVIHHAASTFDPATPQQGLIVLSDPTPIAPDVTTPHHAPHSTLVNHSTLYVAFESAGSIYLTQTSAANTGPGGFSPVRVLDDGGAASPDLNSTSSGILAIAWEKDGDIFHIVGDPTDFPEPLPVLTTEAIESAPVVALDEFANVYLAFQSNGRLFATTDADTPQARFSATPTSGEQPLRVEFRDESAGDVSRWRWDFGDGTTSPLQSPEHVFEETGEYEVTLQVDGPGGTSRREHRETIVVESATNEMWIADVRAFVGQQNIHVPVIVTHDQEAQGFQIAAVFDPAVIEVKDVEFSFTNLGGLSPELADFHVSHDPENPVVIAGVLFDIQPPFDSRVLAPGSAQRLLNIVVDVHVGADPNGQTEIRLVNGMGDPPRYNVITVRSQSILPRLGEPGVIHLESLQEPLPMFFIRGDVDGNLGINLSDAVALLNYLFLGADLPPCPDAADASDDGRLDISDASFLLNFLFRAGSYPLPPYPEPGLDPSEDDFEDCTF